MTENATIDTETMPVADIPELTEEQQAEKAREEKLAAERQKVDNIFEKLLDMGENGYVHSYTEMSQMFNEFFKEHGKKKRLDELGIVKLRVKYGRPAPQCHQKGKEFVLCKGEGRKEQRYVVGADGAWRKVSNA